MNPTYRPSRLPTKDEYLRAWRSIHFGRNERESILAIYNRTSHRATGTQIKDALRYSEKNAIHLRIGSVGEKISTILGIHPPYVDQDSKWWPILCTWSKQTDIWQLHPAFSEAIKEHDQAPPIAPSQQSPNQQFDSASDGQEPENAATTTAVVTLSWRDTKVRDILPLKWFESDSKLIGVAHEMLGPRGGAGGKAKCDVEKNGVIATLDYRPYTDFNKNSGALPGIARLTFTDAERTALVKFEWQDAGGKTFSEGERFECTYELPPAPPYTMPTVPAPKVEQMVRPRPGQELFRTSMHLAYNHRCCMTGSTVAEALEAAHIDDYRAPESNNARNGLLLRRDIHALFDAHLIAIEPGNHVIHIAPSARGPGGYGDLHGKKITLPLEKTHHPDPAALKRRWTLFTNSRS